MFLKCRKTVVVRDLLEYLKNRVEHRKLTSELRQVLAFDKKSFTFPFSVLSQGKSYCAQEVIQFGK